jgi:hypothetical protein
LDPVGSERLHEQPRGRECARKLRETFNGPRAKEVERIAQTLDMFDFRGATKAFADLAGVESLPV